MKTLIAIVTLVFLHITCPMAQVTSESESSQIEELGILDFLYDSRSQSYVVLTDLYIDQDLDESDYQLTLSFDNEDKAQDLPHTDDIQALCIGSHQFTYNVVYDGQLMLNLFNTNGGTPWSTLNSQNLTLSLNLNNTELEIDQDIYTQQ